MHSNPSHPSGLQAEHLSQTFVALWSHPAFQAGLVAILVTGVVSEEVISGPTELVAAEAVVMFCTGHSDLVLKVGYSCTVFQGLPLAAGIDHARVGSLLNNAIGVCEAQRVAELKLPLGLVLNSHITVLQLHRQDWGSQLVLLIFCFRQSDKAALELQTINWNTHAALSNWIKLEIKRDCSVTANHLSLLQCKGIH